MSMNARLEAFLKAHPNEWLPATAFEPIAGRQAWRTRLSEVRRTRGMTIENRTRWIDIGGGLGYTLSEYRFVPARPLGQGALWDEARA